MKRFLFLCVLLAAAPGCSGCGTIYQESIPVVIPPDSTVHLTKEHGTPRQEKTGSGEEERHVYAKRVLIPTETRTLGRGVANYDYIPTVWPVMTSRRPVYRAWTEWKHKGTSEKNEAFNVESLDSINFSTGGVLICRVDYEDTAKYRYRYSGRPLEEVVDRNVRPYFQSRMADRFGRLNLQSEGDNGKDCLTETIPIFKEVFQEAQQRFKEEGITIDYFGNIGGLRPDNKDIQKRLDQTFIRSMNVLVQEERNREMEVQNRMRVALAEAEREAAGYRFEAREAMKYKELFAAVIKEQRAVNEAAMKWGGVERDERNGFRGGGKGQLPSGMMPANSSPLAWLQGSSAEDVLTSMPKELDPKLVEWAKGQAEEIRKRREAERAKQLVEEAERKKSAAEKETGAAKK
jgi:hypothetical protein